MEHLTINLALFFYKQWCKDNNLKPQDYKNLKAYLKEVKGE